MPMIPLKCPICGANLRINSDDSAAICNHCGKPFVVKDAIVDNYVNNNRNMNENDNANRNAVMYAGVRNAVSSDDFVIEAGVLKKYHGRSRMVEIPDDVVVIGREAFKGLSVTKIVIPASVNRIDEGAFYNCSQLSFVNLPDSLTEIESNVFCGCRKLKEVKIPKTLTKIRNGAFASSGLNNIDFPSSLEWIGDYAFAHCDLLENIGFPDKTEDIGDYAFYDCTKLVNVDLSGGKRHIGSSAFEGCVSLASVIFPRNDDCIICNGAFAGCISLRSIDMSNSSKIKMLTDLNEKGIFEDCKKLSDVVLPLNLDSIQYNTFAGCSELKNVVLPSNLGSINEEAFKNCLQLKEMAFPSNLGSIGEGAFRGCVGLNKISISPRTSISRGAFYGCSINIIEGSVNNQALEYGLAGTPYAKRRKEGLCTYCGGKMNLFKTCKQCGRKKSY